MKKAPKKDTTRTLNTLWEPPFPFPRGARHLPGKGIIAASPAIFSAIQARAPEPLEKNLGIFMLGGTSISFGHNYFLAGPILGSPMAVMTLEVLIGGGAKEIVFAGFAGSLVPDINPGDLYFPSSALSTEGTSMHYQPGEMKPDTDLYAKVEKVFSPLGLHRQGVVWSTDGPFRETAELRQSFIQKGASVVEMEVSALLSAASFRKVKLAAVLLITDTFGKGDWYDGFKFPAYKNGLNSLSDNIWNVFR